MTSGLPPDTTERRRGGGPAPGGVPFGGGLSFFAVLLGTVLLSVARGCAASDAVRPSAGHGRPPPGRNAACRPVVGAPSLSETQKGAGCSPIGRRSRLLERGRRSPVLRSGHDPRDCGERGPIGVVVLRVPRVGVGGQFRRAELRVPRIRPEPA